MDVRKASLLIISSRSAIKKRKKINKIRDFYKIFIFIFISFISPFSILIVVVFSRKKFLTYHMIIFGILFFFIADLLNTINNETLRIFTISFIDNTYIFIYGLIIKRNYRILKKIYKRYKK